MLGALGGGEDAGLFERAGEGLGAADIGVDQAAVEGEGAGEALEDFGGPVSKRPPQSFMTGSPGGLCKIVQGFGEFVENGGVFERTQFARRWQGAGFGKVRKAGGPRSEGALCKIVQGLGEFAENGGVFERTEFPRRWQGAGFGKVRKAGGPRSEGALCKIVQVFGGVVENGAVFERTQFALQWQGADFRRRMAFCPTERHCRQSENPGPVGFARDR